MKTRRMLFYMQFLFYFKTYYRLDKTLLICPYRKFNGEKITMWVPHGDIKGLNE